MKKTIIYFMALSAAFLLPGCEDKLVEEPKSLLTPEFFATKQGFESGVSAAYAGNRMLWGSQDLFTVTSIGTDEFQSGQDAGGNIEMNSYTSNYLTNNGIVTNIWKQCYIYINTCNGLVDNANKITGIDEPTKARMIAETKFLRAQYYFMLVQFFGDVTLNKTFQASPSTAADRHPMADTYDFIIQDLQEAIAGLAAAPKDVVAGRANAAAAKHVLAKVYLTRASSKAAQATDYSNAYTTAMDVINNRAALGLGLLPDFDLVHNEGNEASIEVLWTVQHTSTLTHNGSAAQNSSGPDNVLNHMWAPQYEQYNGLVRSMEYGRPYIRCIPTIWNVQTAFAERTNDTRYEKTYQVAWISNADKSIPKWVQADVDAGYTTAGNLGKVKFAVGDTAIYMPGYDMPYDKVRSKRYLVLTPQGPVIPAGLPNAGKRDGNFAYGKRISPTMNKYFDTKRANLNNPSIRPVIVYRLAETYLTAAEAAYKMNNIPEAVTLLNVVRARAARNATAATAMMATTAPDLTARGIDYILDERTRELCGENVRWLDLVRTGKLIERVKLFNPEAGPNIQEKHKLRPVPQTQIDGVLTGTPYPQNEGWQ
jgi:starch-binding outer membrane protein, SusD/RagB family